METYLRFTPVPNLDAPCGHITLCIGPAEQIVQLRFSGVGRAPPKDLIVRFDSGVLAAMSHEEFVHPWQEATNIGDVPKLDRLDGEWAGYAFPLLEVRNSEWLRSFSDGQIFGRQREAARHFRFVSLGQTVDVLTAGDVAAEWVNISGT